jgi:hypothetical protein
MMSKRPPTHKLDVNLGNEQDMTVKQGPMVQERHNALIFTNERHLLLASEDRTEATGGVGGAPLCEESSIDSVKQAGLVILCGHRGSYPQLNWQDWSFSLFWERLAAAEDSIVGRCRS